MSTINNNKESLPLLTTERTYMRLAEESDIPSIISFYQENQNFLQPWSPLFDENFFLRENWEKRIQLVHDEYHQEKSVRLYIFLKENHQLIGMCNFVNFERGSFHNCRLGYQLRALSEGQGLMLESLQSAIHYLFHEKHIHRIEANYMPRNKRSGRLLEKLGFQICGHAPEYLCINGVWEDHSLTYLLNRHWMGPLQKKET